TVRQRYEGIGVGGTGRQQAEGHGGRGSADARGAGATTHTSGAVLAHTSPHQVSNSRSRLSRPNGWTSQAQLSVSPLCCRCVTNCYFDDTAGAVRGTRARVPPGVVRRTEAGQWGPVVDGSMANIKRSGGNTPRKEFVNFSAEAGIRAHIATCFDVH